MNRKLLVGFSLLLTGVLIWRLSAALDQPPTGRASDVQPDVSAGKSSLPLQREELHLAQERSLEADPATARPGEEEGTTRGEDGAEPLPKQIPGASASGHTWADVAPAFRRSLTENLAADPLASLTEEHIWRAGAIQKPDSDELAGEWALIKDRPMEPHERELLFSIAQQSNEAIAQAAGAAAEQELLARRSLWDSGDFLAEVAHGPPRSRAEKGAWKGGSSSLNGWKFHFSIFREDFLALDQALSRLESLIEDQRRDVNSTIRTMP